MRIGENLQRDRPDDARPHLLLARLNLARDRPPRAVFRYTLALRADPSVGADPRLRDDLEALRDDPRAGARARRLLAQIDRGPALARSDAPADDAHEAHAD